MFNFLLFYFHKLQVKVYIERWLGLKLDETEKLYLHPKRNCNSTEIIGKNTVASP